MSRLIGLFSWTNVDVDERDPDGRTFDAGKQIES
jgi:hypothetical protein